MPRIAPIEPRARMAIVNPPYSMAHESVASHVQRLVIESFTDRASKVSDLAQGFAEEILNVDFPSFGLDKPSADKRHRADELVDLLSIM